MPGVFPFVPEDRSGREKKPRDLLDQADLAQAVGDREGCIKLIQQVLDAFERQSIRLARVAAAIITGLSSSWIGDLTAVLLA